MLLIGIGGSGRQSLTRLSSYICEMSAFQIEVTKHYRKAEFRDGMISVNTIFKAYFSPNLNGTFIYIPSS